MRYAKEPRPVGRPTMLTPARFDTIVKLVRDGNFLRVAAEAAGVSERSVYEWIERGELPEEREQDTLFSQFSQAVAKAQAESEQLMVASIQRAASGYTKKLTRTRTYTDPETGRECTEHTIEEAEVFDWRAGAWMLANRHKQRWMPNPPQEASPEGEPVKVLILSREPEVEEPKHLEERPPETIGDVLGV